jgi:hypothetical protein
MLPPPHIVGAEKVISIFGHWPTFHDAEILDAHLTRDRGSPKSPRLELVLRWKLPPSTGHASDSQITLLFNDVEEVELSEFNHQNVVNSLTVSALDHDWLAVDLNSSFGLFGSFRCRAVEVVEVLRLDTARA